MINEAYIYRSKNLLVSLIFCLVLPSLLVSVVIPLIKYGHDVIGLPLLAGISYLSVIFMLLVFNRYINKEYYLVAFLTAISVLFKVLLLLSLKKFPQLGDPSTFHTFTSYLATDGLNPKNISNLSKHFYDYYNWFPRSFPFNYYISLLLKQHDILGVQILNIILSSINIYLFYLISQKIIFKTSVRRYAIILFTFMPLHFWYILQYTHRIQAEFFLLITFYIFLRFNCLRSNYSKIVNSLIFALALFCLHLEGGLDYVLIVAICIYFLYRFLLLAQFGCHSKAKFLLLCTVIIAGYLISTTSFDGWKQSCDTGQLSSGFMGFAARGWNLKTLGEYYSEYEQIDRVTPGQIKKTVMTKIILSQIYYNPIAVFIKLIPSKITKFFLIGYATNFRKSLATSSFPLFSSVFFGMRLIFAPFFLCLVLLGCIFMIYDHQLSAPFFLIMFFTIVLFLAFIFFGEASPMYSYYLYFCLGIFAAYGIEFLIDRLKKTNKKHSIKKFPLIKWCVFWLLIYLVFAITLSIVVKLGLNRFVFENISNQEAQLGLSNIIAAVLNPPKYIVRDLKFTAADAELRPREYIAAELLLPESRRFIGKKKISFYIIRTAMDKKEFDNLVLTILLNRTLLGKVKFEDLRRTSRFDFKMPVSLCSEGNKIILEFRIMNIDNSPIFLSSKDTQIRVGYLSFDS